jgi:hypothetical protein
MNNLIDFHGATHGHFLEYIINTWIYQGSRVDNVFTELGTCHNPGNNPALLTEQTGKFYCLIVYLRIACRGNTQQYHVQRVISHC